MNTASHPTPDPQRGGPAAKALGWVLTLPQLAAFAAVLLLFHPLQVIARVFGYGAHKRVVDWLNLSLLQSLRLVGTHIELDCSQPLPAGRPLLVVSNHQSMYDIPLLGWVFRRHHPKFVAKAELGRGLPSVSYNLRHGGSVLIDRSDPRQSLPALAGFGDYIETHGYTACIFPEGTRARDGAMKPFNAAGFRQLLRSLPTALIVPVAIEGSWELVRYGMRPIPFGVRLRCTVLPPLEQDGRPARDLLGVAEDRIRDRLTSPAATAAIQNDASGASPGPDPGP